MILDSKDPSTAFLGVGNDGLFVNGLYCERIHDPERVQK